MADTPPAASAAETDNANPKTTDKEPALSTQPEEEAPDPGEDDLDDLDGMPVKDAHANTVIY